MNSTADRHPGEATPQSLRAAWQYGRQVWHATSGADAWSSFKKVMEAMPVWALVVFVTCILVMLANAWVVFVPLAAIAFLMVIFITVKRAILSALRQHDTQRQQRG